jgi:LysM repeat protein
MLRDTSPLESIIVEYGFLDNTNDAIRLKNNYSKYAADVVEAILDYKGINYSNEYVVKSGDTLYSIAKKYNTTVKKLMDINNLTSSILKINQVLKLNDDYYTVKAKDTLYSIAKKYNTTVNKLKDINNLSTDILSIGQKLKIPDKVIHKVSSGETLYSIAKLYNVSVNDIKEANNLTNNLISINQELIIPFS